MAAQVQGLSWLELAREVFPDADDDTLSHHLWEYTGFPGFFDGDPETECRRQLVAARDAMARGEVFDMEQGWVPNERAHPLWQRRGD